MLRRNVFLKVLSLRAAIVALLFPVMGWGSPKAEWKEIETGANQIDELRAKAGERRSSSPRSVAEDPLLATAVMLNLRLEAFIKRNAGDKRWADARALHALIMPEVSAALNREVSVDDWLAALAEARALPGLSRKLDANVWFRWLDVSFKRGEKEGFPAGQLESLLDEAQGFVKAHKQHVGAAIIAMTAGRLLVQRDEAQARGLLEQARKLADRFDAKLANAAEQELAVLAFRHRPVDLRFTAADGRVVDFATLRGKVVVVDFWASWCPPCRQEAPELVALYRQYRDAGLEVVGVSLDENRGKMDAFAKQVGMDWPHYFDGGGWNTKLSRDFAIASIPTVWVIGRDGRLADHDARGKLEALVPSLLRSDPDQAKGE